LPSPCSSDIKMEPDKKRARSDNRNHQVTSPAGNFISIRRKPCPLGIEVD
jgi:hypothetical protein